VKYREFLSQLLKSVKSGRIHKLLKLFIVLLFLYLSFQVGRELLDYYLSQKEKLFISLKGLKWEFSLRKGELSVSFKELEVDSGRFSLSVERGKGALLLYDSVARLKPHFSLIRADRVEVSLPAGKEEKSRKFKFSLPPLLVDRLEVGYLFVEKGDFLLYGRELYKGERELRVGGISGKAGEKYFYLFPFTGYLKDGKVYIPQVELSYGNVFVRGELRFDSEESKGGFRGSVVGSSFLLDKLIVKINGDKFAAEVKGKIKGREFKAAGEGCYSLREPEVIIRRGKGEFEGIELEYGGILSLRELFLNGSFRGKLKEGGIEVDGVQGEFSLKGKVKEPVLKFKLSADRLVNPVIDLRRVDGKGEVSRERGVFVFRSEGIKGKVEYENRKVKGVAKLHGFRLERMKQVALYKKRYGKWIPSVVVGGELSFGYKRGGELSYRGDIRVEDFFFRGYRGKGRAEVKGNGKKLLFRISLKGTDGSVEGRGKVDVAGGEISSRFSSRELELSSVDFLRKLGLKGKVSGSGEVFGSLRNPKVRFGFSCGELSLWGVYLPSVEGSVIYRDYALLIAANSPAGVKLRELRVGIKDKSIGVKVEVSDFSASSVLKVIKGFGLELPFNLSGALSGRAEIALLLKRPGESEVKVELAGFKGDFEYPGILELSGTGSGEFVYRKGLYGEFSGEVEEGKFKGVEFEKGEYGVKFRGFNVAVSYRGVKLKGEFEGVKSSGEVLLGLKDGSLEGKVGVEAKLGREFGSFVGGGYAFFEGLVPNFTVKVSGKGKVESEYLKEPIEFKVEGAVLEPRNQGNIRIFGERCDVHLLLFGDRGNLVGSVKGIEFRSPRAEVRVNLAFVNLGLPELEGLVSVPTFTVKPYGFYKLYSPTGVYLKIKGRDVSVSPFTLSYVDGWIEFKEPRVEPLSAEFEAQLGAKGLIYLFKLNGVLPYARGDLKVNGKFRYAGKLEYDAAVRGDGISLKSLYLLDRLIVSSLEAEVRNGELEELKGELSVGDGNVLINRTNHEVVIAVSQIPVGQIEVWKSLLSGNLSYDLKKRSLTGSVELSRTKLFFKKPEEKREEETGRGEVTKIPIKVKVSAIFDEPVKLKGELFWIEILPSLRLTTVNGEPVISGNFYVTSGEINYMGKKFKVLYGSGTIEDLQRKRGRVSVLASARISGYYVYMKIEGELSSPTIYLTSDPPLTREQIMNLIMTGASPEQIEASSELFPAVQIAYYAASSFFKPIEGKFQKALGLESFSVEPYITKYGETVAKLTITKRLSKRIKLIGYETTGQNPEYGGSVELYLNDRYYLELRYNSYYGAEAGIGFEVRIR